MTAMTLPSSSKVPASPSETAPESPLLAVDELRVAYGRRVAVDAVSFSVHAGEIFGLLGPNGAGKTSTLSAIEGLIIPERGTIRVAGIDVQERPLDARANLGVQLQATSFQKDLTVTEIVRLYGGLYGIVLNADGARGVLAAIDLSACAGMKAGQLSGGQLQRLSLATATLHDPPLLLLDEPTTGLDPQSRRRFWSKIETMRDSGRAILLTTHSMEEAHAVCDRVSIIDRGRIIVTGPPQAIVDSNKDRPEVRAAARRPDVTLEDVFIGLTGAGAITT